MSRGHIDRSAADIDASCGSIDIVRPSHRYVTRFHRITGRSYRYVTRSHRSISRWYWCVMRFTSISPAAHIDTSRGSHRYQPPLISIRHAVTSISTAPHIDTSRGHIDATRLSYQYVTLSPQYQRFLIVMW